MMMCDVHQSFRFHKKPNVTQMLPFSSHDPQPFCQRMMKEQITYHKPSPTAPINNFLHQHQHRHKQKQSSLTLECQSHCPTSTTVAGVSCRSTHQQNIIQLVVSNGQSCRLIKSCNTRDQQEVFFVVTAANAFVIAQSCILRPLKFAAQLSLSQFCCCHHARTSGGTVVPHVLLHCSKGISVSVVWCDQHHWDVQGRQRKTKSHLFAIVFNCERD